MIQNLKKSIKNVDCSKKKWKENLNKHNDFLDDRFIKIPLQLNTTEDEFSLSLSLSFFLFFVFVFFWRRGRKGFGVHPTHCQHPNPDLHIPSQRPISSRFYTNEPASRFSGVDSTWDCRAANCVLRDSFVRCIWETYKCSAIERWYFRVVGWQNCGTA